MGATYASMFPARTGRLVLDSPMDAETWVHRPFEALREQTAGLEDGLRRFFAATGYDEDAFDALVAELDREPLGNLDGDDVRVAAISVTSPREWPDFKAALEQAQAGDGTALRAMTDALYGGALLNPDLAVAEQALDQRYPSRVKPFLRAGRHAEALFPHFAFNSGFSELPYGVLPVSDEDAFFGPFRNAFSAPPALVIGTTHDPYTPYVWAQRLTHDLGNARLLTYNGDGHGRSRTSARASSGTCSPTWRPACCRPRAPAATRSSNRRGRTARRRRRRPPGTCPWRRPLRCSGRRGARPCG